MPGGRHRRTCALCPRRSPGPWRSRRGPCPWPGRRSGVPRAPPGQASCRRGPAARARRTRLRPWPLAPAWSPRRSPDGTGPPPACRARSAMPPVLPSMAREALQGYSAPLPMKAPGGRPEAPVPTAARAPPSSRRSVRPPTWCPKRCGTCSRSGGPAPWWRPHRAA